MSSDEWTWRAPYSIDLRRPRLARDADAKFPDWADAGGRASGRMRRRLVGGAE
jgi:hypothetical protein